MHNAVLKNLAFHVFLYVTFDIFSEST